jgi:hypothetical protein
MICILEVEIQIGVSRRGDNLRPVAAKLSACGLRPCMINITQAGA